jgi:hypothetical protein
MHASFVTLALEIGITNNMHCFLPYALHANIHIIFCPLIKTTNQKLLKCSILLDCVI